MAESDMSPEDLGGAGRLGAATLGESGGRAAHRRLRPAWAGASLAAPAYPVGCTPGDNLAVHVAVTTAPAGQRPRGRRRPRGGPRVLGRGADDGRRGGGPGGPGARRWGARRAALAAHGFPVFSSAIALTGATKDKPGTVGWPVRVGDVEVAAGDWVVADVDGVTFVPAATVEEVLDAGRAREAKEDGFFAALRDGETTVELLGLDASLVRGPEG